MKKHTFVLSDESVNSFGQIVLTQGIDTKNFEKNPIMLYMHERSTVIGRWDNIRKEDNKLLADAVFDTNIELAKTVKSQVDDGILRAVSIGVSNGKVENINGVETIVKCELTEASIVDIPANKNAVKLKHKGKVIKFVCLTEPEQEPQKRTNQKTDILSQIRAFLGLNEDCTDEDILSALKALKTRKPEETPEEVQKALQFKLITGNEFEKYKLMDRGGKTTFLLFCNKLIDKHNDTITELVNDACNAGKVVHFEKHIFENIGRTMGEPELKKVIACMSGSIRPTDLLQGGKVSGDRSNWGLTEYRKFAANELKNNPELYRHLLEKEEIKTDGGGDLAWYRKHNPDYLLQNPKEYKRLLEQERKKYENHG